MEGKIKVMCEFRDAKQKLQFYVVKTDSKTVLSLQTCRELAVMQILNEVTPKEEKKIKKEKMEGQWKEQILRRKLR